jgi:transcriptional regulator with XRE-family HTH domain
MKTEENMITNWLDQHGDPEIDKFIEKNLAIAVKVNAELRKRNWSQAKFADEIGKKPSEVSRWLTGTHNLTLKSIVKMEMALGIVLIYTEPVKEFEYVYLGLIENHDELQNKATDYSETTEMHEYLLAM